MLQIIIFCYSEGIFSSREIEKSCKYDLRIKFFYTYPYKNSADDFSPTLFIIEPKNDVAE